MQTLEDTLKRQELLNDRLLDLINSQRETVTKLVGVEIETGIAEPCVDHASPNGLIEELAQAQERTNSLLSLYSYNNGRLRDAVFVKEEAVNPMKGVRE